MIDGKTRQMLYSEAHNYTDRDAYISDLAMSSVWGDTPDDEIPRERFAVLGRIYDAAHATILSLLAQYCMSQADFARYFGIPLRSVQDWCGGRRACPPYVVTMAAEILSLDK